MATTIQTPKLTPQEAEEHYKETRRTFVGGSEVYELLNQQQYNLGCATALGFRKLGVPPDYDDIDDDDAILKRGKILEPLVTSLYEEQTGRKLRRPPMDEYGYTVPKRHPKYPWAGVSTDRIILSGSGNVTEPGDLEIKTRGEGPFLRVKRSGPFPGDMLQPQWSLFVTGHSWGALATLGVFGGLPLVHFDVNRSQELQDIFVREGEAFANEVWGKGKPPVPTFSHTDQRCRVCVYRMTCRGEEIDKAEAAAIREIKKSSKNLVQITNPELSHTLADIDLLKQEQKSIEQTLELAKTKALEMVGDNDAILLKGYGKVYRMASQANYFDSTQFKADDPETYERYFVSKKTGAFHLRTYPEKTNNRIQQGE